MNKLQKASTKVAEAGIFWMALLSPNAAFAQIANGANSAKGNDQPDNLFTGSDPLFKRITNILLFLVGAISVIMLIIGGIRYVVSGGDQNAVQGAKNTILYAIVGIVVAILAYGAVNFVIDSLL